MILIDNSNRNQVLSFLPLIKDNYNEWHVVNLKFDADNKTEAKEIVLKFIEGYSDSNGFVYLESNKNAISVIRLGVVESYSAIQETIEEKIDDKRCSVRAQKMTKNGLKQIQINLSDGKSTNSKLFKMREERESPVIMVVDDDMFIRKTVSSYISQIAEVHEFPDATQALKAYSRINPDIVVLDIHLPDMSGLDVIKNLINEDSNAFILISSSDSTMENVQVAIDKGAAGFLAKPIQKERLLDYSEKCITFTLPANAAENA